jgi:hypothetical protein
MRAMFRDECHPDVSLSYWEAFRNEVSPYLIEKVLDRSETRLPRWYLPLARGAAIPCPYLLGKAGHRPRSHRARGWLKPSGEEVFKVLGGDCLIVLRCKPFWRIALNTGGLGRPHDHTNYALVHIFGSTPILTRTYQEATYLAEFCWLKRPPSGLCWVHECPDDMDAAIDFSLDRGLDEAGARALRLALAAASPKYHER